MGWQTRWQKAILGALVVAMAGVNAAWAADYTWKGANNDDWSVAGSWDPAGGPPLAADSATFAGTLNRTVDIAAGNQAVSNITVAGTASWYWDGVNLASHNTLTLGAGNLIYNGSNTFATLSSFNATLAGGGKVIMNSGVLRIGDRYVHNNSFSGGVEINGGVLGTGHHINYEVGHPSDLGSGPIALGSTSAGSNDAALLFHCGVTYANPLTVRGGNSGVARLGRWNQGPDGNPAAYFSGSITLQKDLTIVNDESGVNATVGQREKYFPLYLSGPMTGSGNVTKEGVGNIYLTGMNSYTGATTIRGGTVYIAGTANSNTGNFTVVYGALIAHTNNSLGSLANTVTLGGNGTFGEFGSYRASGSTYVTVPFSRSITLAGNGGILSSRGAATRWQMDGVISGSGRLILAPGGDRNSRSCLNGNNLYTGGTIANNGYVDINNVGAVNNTVYGSGDIWVLRAGNLYVRGANNIGTGAKVRIETPGALSVMTEYVPDITTNSDGIIGFGLTTGSTINDRFASSTPLGNGTMRLGATPDASSIFTGSSLAALVANDPTHTYRLGGNGYSAYMLSMDASGTAGALKDIGGNPHNVVMGGMRVDLADDNPFTGTLTVQSGASCYGYLVDAAGNPFGANTGAVVLQGAKSSHGSKFHVMNVYNVTRSVSKGAVSFDGSVGPFSIDGKFAGLPTWTTTVEVASLDRVGRSTLSIDAIKTTLGDKERLTVSGGVLSDNGMVAPYLWNGVDAVFLDYGANGFTNAGWDETLLSGATANEKVNITVAAQVPATGVSLYALKSSVAISANGAAVLTNHSGGMILSGNGITHSAPMDFGVKEAVVYTTQANTLSGRMTGSGGLTKSGAGTLSLSADNTGFTGGFTVNEGTLGFSGWANFGGVANTITLNGGVLQPVSSATAITNNIVLGTLGGSLYGGTYAGNISGPGTLILSYANGPTTLLKGANNTYSGGTVVYGQTVTMAAGSSLSTGGTVTVQSGGYNLGNERAVLRLNDAGNLTTAHRLVVNSYNGTVLMFSTTPVVGSIEGNGIIVFGATTHSSLRVGGNNLSTDYFGVLAESWQFVVPPQAGTRFGTLIKEGTGTLTLWGENLYRGGTIVSNGTLCVNNWLNPVGTVVVKPGATLDGIGTVGVVDNQGGTVKGNLVTAGLTWGADSAMQVALNGAGPGEYDVLTVNGPVALNGGSVSIDLNFMPVLGQEFTIIANDGTDPVTGGFDSDMINITYNGGVVRFQVVINGGDGNDVTLVRVPVGTMILVR